MSELTENSYKPLPGQEPIVRHRRSDKRRKKKRENRRELIGTILYVIIICAFAFVVLRYVGQRTVVRGHSMDPTLNDGENLIMDKFTYHFSDPERYDIVICRYPGRGDTNFVKRVVGLPGDTVELRDGYLYINGEKQEEPYINDEYRSGWLNEFSAYTVPEGEYFVMGDHRNNSNDSRSIGPIGRDYIIGHVRTVVFPFNHWRGVK